jgi:hypothetical protein
MGRIGPVNLVLGRDRLKILVCRPRESVTLLRVREFAFARVFSEFIARLRKWRCDQNWPRFRQGVRLKGGEFNSTKFPIVDWLGERGGERFGRHARAARRLRVF